MNLICNMLHYHLPPISRDLWMAELVHCPLAAALCWHGTLSHRCALLKHCLAKQPCFECRCFLWKCNTWLKTCLLWIRCHSVLGSCFWFPSCPIITFPYCFLSCYSCSSVLLKRNFIHFKPFLYKKCNEKEAIINPHAGNWMIYIPHR